MTATDGHGNVATKSFNVTVQDTTKPTITTVYSNQTLEATGPGGATATFAAASATDLVTASPTITYSQASGTTFAIGVNTVTVTATDAAGNASTKTFTVTVRDTTTPVITSVPANIVVEAAGPTGTVVTYAPATATDAVGYTITYSKSSGSTFAIGTTTVTVTATDAAGNHSSRTFTVTVQDTTKPVLTVSDMTVQATQPGGWLVGTFSATATDAVGATITYSKAVGTVLPFGPTTITATAKDAAGNSVSATFVVTVIDTIAPVITSVSANVTAEATSAAGAAVNYGAATATDAAGPITYTYSKASGSTFAIGLTTVLVTATDGHGNSSTATFTVTVQDTTAPTINAPLYAVGEATSLAGANVTYPVTTFDAVGPVTVSYSIPNGSFFPMSFTGPVTVTATDAYGNTSIATFAVFVHDSTAPAVMTSANIVAEATGPSGVVVNYAPAIVTDALGATLVNYSKASGTVFAIGTTMVSVTAFDLVGNCTVKTFTVTVRDTTPPVITSWSGPVTAEATGPSGAVVTYAPATATDAVGPVTISYSKSSGSTFAIGTTTVTVTAKDGAGNFSTKTFTVLVHDTTAPVIVSTSGNLTVEATSAAGATVTYAAATATDAVGYTITYSQNSGTVFAIGTTTVTVTAKDAAGNLSTKTFTVLVHDTTAPVITSTSGNLTVEATSVAGATVTYAAATATDAVGATITYSQSSGTVFALGTTTVTVTATDPAGNYSSKTFTVLVRDTTAPVITSVPASFTVEATGSNGATVTYAPAAATDTVSGVVLTYSQGSGTVFALGTTTVTVTATDAANNHSTKTFTVTVKDSTPPVLVVSNLTFEATSAAGAAVTFTATASDLVSTPTITYSKTNGSTFAIGTTTVTATATDAAGNSVSKTFTVKVQDTTAPVLTQPSIVVEATSSSGAKVTYASSLITDAVGVTSLTFSKATGSTFAIGSTTVTFTAKDAAGNTTNGSFTVVVHDTTAPVITTTYTNLTFEATSGLGAIATYAAAAATDAVGPVTYSYSQGSGTTFAIGTTTVTVTAKDAYGNISTKTFTVTVRDTTPPVITSSWANITLEATSSMGAIATYAAGAGTDATGIVTFTYSQNSGTYFAIGTTTVTVTAKDAYGNASTKTFTVTVKDTTPPVITSVPASITVAHTSSHGAYVSYPAATATDLTGTVTITYSKASGSQFAIGKTTVTVTATDAYGNVSTKTFTITVT